MSEETNEVEETAEESTHDLSYDLEYEDGAVVASVSYSYGELADANLQVRVGIIQALELAAQSTENTVDDKLVALVKAALAK